MKIIAEIGVNHNSNLNIAKKLIKECALAKADFVKFQMFSADATCTKWSKKANYQTRNLNTNISQYEMLKKYELNYNKLEKLKHYSNLHKINFLVSVFDIYSFKLFLKLKLKIIKIPSGEITNFPLLEEISKHDLRVIISTGMAKIDEINSAIKILLKKKIKKKNLIILHCNTNYPTPLNEVNLKFIEKLKKKYNTKIGYSDHTKGTIVPIICASKEIDYLEKHVTFDKNSFGPDHKASISTKELKLLIKEVKKIGVVLGKEKKIINKSELENLKYVRKSIVAKKFIRKGELFSKRNITTKRPGYGLSAKYYNKILKKKSKYFFKIDDLIKI